MTDPSFLGLIAALTVASYACRAGGFWLMRFINVTPRVEAALRAAPLSVMVGVVAPAALRGGVAELVGLAVVGLAMWWRRNDVLAMLAGVAAVAVARAWLA